VQDGPVPADFRAVGEPARGLLRRGLAPVCPACSDADWRPSARPAARPQPSAQNRAECLMLWWRHKNCGTGFVSAHRYRECANCCIME
jgi:hypothetical protein